MMKLRRATPSSSARAKLRRRKRSPIPINPTPMPSRPRIATALDHAIDMRKSRAEYRRRWLSRHDQSRHLAGAGMMPRTTRRSLVTMPSRCRPRLARSASQQRSKACSGLCRQVYCSEPRERPARRTARMHPTWRRGSLVHYWPQVWPRPCAEGWAVAAIPGRRHHRSWQWCDPSPRAGRAGQERKRRHRGSWPKGVGRQSLRGDHDKSGGRPV